MNSHEHRSSWIKTFLIILVLVLIAVSLYAADRKPAVEADFEKLRTVIVMSVDDSIYKSSEMGSSIHPIFNKGLAPGAITEHRALVRLLEKAGVKVLQVRDLLQDAIDNARRRGDLEAWIRRNLPRSGRANPAQPGRGQRRHGHSAQRRSFLPEERPGGTGSALSAPVLDVLVARFRHIHPQRHHHRQRPELRADARKLPGPPDVHSRERSARFPDRFRCRERRGDPGWRRRHRP